MNKAFFYEGELPSSKSILNRLLIIQSYSDRLVVHGESNAEDVCKMRSALRAMQRGEIIDCGAAGTTFRFMALRAARTPGRHRLTGSKKLFQRPQDELVHLLNQLGCEAHLTDSELFIASGGWKSPQSGFLHIDQSVSSQFASAVLLNAWGLEHRCQLRFTGSPVSKGYLGMTLSLLKAAGMDVIFDEGDLVIPAQSCITAQLLEAEIDLSSAFSVAAVAVARRGRAHFHDFPKTSLQPDVIFSNILQQMGCVVQEEDGCLKLDSTSILSLQPINYNLNNAPDLFPVLAVLCALAEGESLLFGAPHLAFKESNRIDKTAELISLLGAKFEYCTGGLRIFGVGSQRRCLEKVEFDPLEDHRLAMAAAVARAAGYPIHILNPSVVQKSFPGFWDALVAAEPVVSWSANFTESGQHLQGAITILPEQVQNQDQFTLWLSKKLEQGLTWFELRDDLLTADEMTFILTFLPKNKALVSFRNREREQGTRNQVLAEQLSFDWPCDWGECPLTLKMSENLSVPRYFSLHTRLPHESLQETLQRFSALCMVGAHLKLAVEIKSFSELLEGDAWFRADPKRRNFLPSSPDGRWSWYRLLRGPEMSLNFVREGIGTSPDQPTILQWEQRKTIPNRQGTIPIYQNDPNFFHPFAAVIGDPVAHSRTPMEHYSFFQPLGVPVFSIRVTEEEMKGGALQHLATLGLRYVAVTSPLKKAVLSFCGELDAKATELGSVNTMVYNAAVPTHQHPWCGTCTDLEGLQEAVSNEQLEGPVAVWGGGGTLAVLRAVFPQAHFFSARTGQNRDAAGPTLHGLQPHTIVWAAGNGLCEPPISRGPTDPTCGWKPQTVFDLSYREDSAARAIALRCGARYISGLQMFFAQAKRQRFFWEHFMGRKL